MPQTLTQCGFVRYNRDADGGTGGSSGRRVSLEDEDDDNDDINDDNEEDEFQEFTQEFTQRVAFHENDDDFLQEEDGDDVAVAEDEIAVAAVRHSTSPQAANNKKRRIECRQSTIDFPKITDESNALTEKQQHFKDTSDRCFVPNGFKMQVYNKNETWIIEVNRGQSHGIEQYLFTINDFVVKRAHKFGLSHRPLVCSLARTFIGSAETHRLLQDPAWQRMHPIDPGLVDCYKATAKHVLSPADGSYRLRQLRALDKNAPPFYRLSADIPPEPSLVYEENLDQQGTSQFTIVYRQKHHNVEKNNSARGVRNVFDHHNNKKKHKPVALDLFAGAGGMGFGLAKAGFDVKFAVEINPAATATLRCNHRDTLVFEEDATLFLEKAKAQNPCYPKPGDVQHIHASSPCQGFSEANRNGGVNDFANNELSFLFVDAVRHFMPRTGSFENVLGMLNEARGNRRYMQKIIADLMLLGVFYVLFCFCHSR
jgi:16S rRNA G966 N2-methylase RsmD